MEREGTLVERGARTAEEVRLVSFAEDAIDLLNRKGYAIYVISNYPEVAHRVVSLEEAARIHAAFEKLIDPRGNLISSYKYCHHLPGDPDCACHKPKTGNLPRVHLGSLIAYEKSFAVGDMVCDVRFGFAFRGTGALVETGNGKKTLEEELVHLTELHAKTMVCSNLLNFAESVPNHSKE